MKRSEHVSLGFMGVAAFAATFASATLYMAKPGTSAQSCTTRPDGAQICERRGFSAYLFHGWSGSSSAEPKKIHGAALISNANASGSASAANTGVARGGFGATGASTSFRASAGG